VHSEPEAPLGLCRVLDEDPDLALAVPPPRRSAAIAECLAGLVRIPAGRLRPTAPRLGRGAIGLLVLDGLLIRRVAVDGRWAAELLGAGDLLRPWQGEEADLGLLGAATGWRVLEPARLAVLDARAAERLARHPELTGALVARALERSRQLAAIMAIIHQPRVQTRLKMLFWLLAQRWGRVSPEGVLLPLRLSHSVLAELLAAQRPTISSALAELARRGELSFEGNCWRLAGWPPAELLALGASGERSVAGAQGPAR
jgi:CRP/FNR family cyclic AMP-dependent transcriptional regulator